MGVFGFPDPYTSDEDFVKMIKEAGNRGLIIAELLKIKGEIIRQKWLIIGNSLEENAEKVVFNDVIEIIDKHIAELKGE